MAANPSHLHALLELRPGATYARARVGFIAHRAETELVNLMGSVTFTMEEEAEDAGTFEIGPFMLHVGHYDARSIEEALRGLGQTAGKLQIPGHSLTLVEARPERGWYALHAQPSLQGVLGWPVRRAKWSGESVDKLMRAEDYDEASRRLPGLEPCSFKDWAAVTRWAVPTRAIEGAFGPGWNSVLDLNLLTNVRFHRMQFNTERGTLDIHVDARHHEDSLGVVVRDSTGERELARFRAPEFVRNLHCGHLCVTPPLRADDSPVLCDLLLHGALLERWSTGVPPSPVRLYAGVDPDRTWLDRLLKKATKGNGDSPSLERWVHGLLSLSGLSVVHFGHGQELFPDLVAWVPPNGALAIEVSLAAPDLNKLVELERRALSLRRAAASSVPPGAILPAMVFAQTSREVGQEIWRASSQHGIALVPWERIQQIHDSVLAGTVQGGGIVDLLVSWGAHS